MVVGGVKREKHSLICGCLGVGEVFFWMEWNCERARMRKNSGDEVFAKRKGQEFISHKTLGGGYEREEGGDVISHCHRGDTSGAVQPLCAVDGKDFCTYPLDQWT